MANGARQDVPEELKRAANGLLKWWGTAHLGGTDVLAWVMKDGTNGVAIQGPALRIETRCFGDEIHPIDNHDGAADVALQRALGFDAELEIGRGWRGVKGGLGQTMSDGLVTFDEVDESLTSVLGAALNDSVHFTLMPSEGKPWNEGDACTPYYSARKRKVLCGKKPEGLIKVEISPAFGSEEQGPIKASGVDFCTVAPRMRETEGGIVGVTQGMDASEVFMLTHSFNLDPTYAQGSPAESAKAIHECGGLLFPSLALGDVPASNFGSCCIVARLPVALRVLKPYKPRSQGAWPVVVYETDAWTGTTRDFLRNASATLFEQLTGTWEPFSYGHMMVLGPKVSEYAGPAEAKIIKAVSQLQTAIRKKRTRWHRDMTADAIEAASDMSDLRYPYLEVKINGILEVPDTFPLAVCPGYLKSKAEKFLRAIGFNGVLLTVPVAGEFKDRIRQDKGTDWNTAVKAQWDYAWKARDAIIAWQKKQDAKVDSYRLQWKEDSIGYVSTFRGRGPFAASETTPVFNQPTLTKPNPVASLRIDDPRALSTLGEIEGDGWFARQLADEGKLRLANGFHLNLQAWRLLQAMGSKGRGIELSSLDPEAGVILGTGETVYAVKPDGEVVLLAESTNDRCKLAKAAWRLSVQ